jgi:hypothetical protein
MSAIMDGSLWEFIGLGLALFGGAAWMMGQALAITWRNAWYIVPYCALLAASERFLSYALFGGRLTSLFGFLAIAIVLGAIALAAYRATRAGQMAQQYPWLFDRAGPFSWREKR